MNDERKQPSCKERWAHEKDGRIADLRKLWRSYCKGEESDEDLGSLFEYGLCFDYVAPKTFKGQREGYWRYQLSWGGPSDEFRFYSSGPTDEPYRITYQFADWFDGYERVVAGNDHKLMSELWNWFSEMGSTQAEYDKARVE